MTRRQVEQFIKKYGTPVAILAGAAIIGVSVYFSFGHPNNRIARQIVAGQNTKSDGLNPSPVPPPAPPPVVEISIDDDEVMGDPNAPVTIVEFGDFQCPYCRALWKSTLPEVKKEFIDTGKAKFVYRDFPLDNHPAAQVSAEATECAADQGKFWEMHDKMYAEQEKLGTGTIEYGEEEIKLWAKQIGLDTVSFNQCLTSRKYKDEVAKDREDGTAAGVTGTPNTFVNGRKIPGVSSFAAFKKIIEEELKK